MRPSRDMLRKLLPATAGGLLVALLLCVLVELGFRASGVSQPTPGRVCDPAAAYFLPDPEEEGAWKTTYWGNPAEEVSIPPRPRRRTVMIFGGSNAWTFRDQMLRNSLKSAAPRGRRNFRVVNLGRNGFGSERVRLIFEQAVERFAPQVAVFYFGDNEFVESPWPSAVHTLPKALRGSSTARTVAGLVERARAREPRLAEPWAADWNYYSNFEYEQTLAQLEILRENLRSMLETARRSEVKVAVCTVVYNRFSAPRGVRFGARVSREDRERFTELRSQAVALLPAFVSPLLPSRDDEHLRRMDWEFGTGEEPEAREDGRRVGVRGVSGRLVGVDPFLPPAEKWNSKIWRLDAALAELHARELTDAQRDDLRRARGLLDDALALAPDQPRALFERALVAYLLAEDPELVERLFLDSARFDRSPKMSNEAINDILREVAAEYPEVLLIDVDERFASWSPDRLVGWEVMYDHCHLLPGPSRLVMDLVGEEIVARWFAND